MFSKLRIGIIGLGNISAIHIKTFLNNDAVRICALADTSISALQKNAMVVHGRKLFTDYHEMLLDPEIDVVDILLPHYLHAPVLREALIAGKHVICEKPLVTDPKDMNRIISLSKKSGKAVHLKQYFRFSSLHQKMMRLILDGAIGRPYLINCVYTTDAVRVYNDASSWRFNTYEAGGGVFMDVGIHILDFLQELFGDPISVISVMRRNFTSLSMKGEDVCAVTLEYRGGIIANILCTAGDSSFGFRWEKHVYGTNGSLHLEDFGKSRLEMTTQSHQKIVKQDVEYAWWDRANSESLNDIVQRVIENRPPRISLADVQQTLRVIKEAYNSSITGKKVDLY